MSSHLKIPDDIRRKIEARSDAEEILEVIESLQADKIAITNDLYQAIVTTLRLSAGIVDN